ncbi:unnamed protein product, partial [Polarella glacialis]
ASASFPEMEDFKKYYPHGFHKTCRLGRPVYIERLGRMDVQGLLNAVDTARLVLFFAHEAERQTCWRLPACSLAAGRLVQTSVTILDLDGLGLRTVTNTTVLRIIQEVIREQDAHFPEISGGMIIVNAPSVFSMVWAVQRLSINPGTLEKIKVFRAGQEKKPYWEIINQFSDKLQQPVAPEDVKPEDEEDMTDSHVKLLGDQNVPLAADQESVMDVLELKFGAPALAMVETDAAEDAADETDCFAQAETGTATAVAQRNTATEETSEKIAEAVVLGETATITAATAVEQTILPAISLCSDATPFLAAEAVDTSAAVAVKIPFEQSASQAESNNTAAEGVLASVPAAADAENEDAPADLSPTKTTATTATTTTSNSDNNDNNDSASNGAATASSSQAVFLALFRLIC